MIRVQPELDSKRITKEAWKWTVISPWEKGNSLQHGAFTISLSSSLNPGDLHPHLILGQCHTFATTLTAAQKTSPLH